MRQQTDTLRSPYNIPLFSRWLKTKYSVLLLTVTGGYGDILPGLKKLV